MICSICGKIIDGKYIRDYWNNVYHAEHVKESPECFYCGRLLAKKITGGGKKYPDGRVICAHCLKHAITGEKQAFPLLKEARSRLMKHGIVLKGEFAQVYLLDRKHLAKVSGRREAQSEEAGFTKLRKKIVNGKLASFSMEIYILKGLPKVYFIATAAHELMHIWQHLYAVPENDRALREGSCNYAAYLVLAELAREPSFTDAANYVIKTIFETKDKIYGKGFIRVYEMVKKRGVEGWLQYLRRNKK